MRIAFALMSLALLGGCGEAGTAQDAPAKPPAREIALSTSLPIYWPEADDMGDLLSASEEPHWARAVMEQAGTLRPLDTLAGGEGETLGLPHDALLVLVQPYPFAPQENVALDNWVRAGGTVLLFVDPMLTFHSHYALGDRRRPQDIAMLSPILRRWGLDLQFDEDQGEGERAGEAFGIAVPVNLAGQFVARESMRPCVLSGGGLAARCEVGHGMVYAVADAALFDAEGAEEARISALSTLIDGAFAAR